MIESGSGRQFRPGLAGAHGRLIARAGVLAIVVGLGVGLGLHFALSRSATPAAVVSSRHGLDGEATWAAGARVAPAINTLRDQAGQPFSLAKLHGKTVAVVFWDSHCHQECPLEGRQMAAIERSLPRAQRPVLVVVSVNPAQDTPASVKAAVRAWGLAGLAPWYWLMGSRARLAPIWRAYHIYVAPHPVNGDIAHTEAVVLLDRSGYERSAYLFPFAARFFSHDLRHLAAERPS